LISLAGSWLAILSAVLTSRTIVQRLSGYEWHACSQVLAASRRFYALRLCLAELKKYYQELVEPSVPKGMIHPQFCPSINSFNELGSTITFTYVRPLELDPACVVFLARRDDNQKDIVVKFVRRYSVEAHRLMAAKNFAPHLICHQPLGEGYGDLALVVMDYVHGKTLHDLYNESEVLDPDVHDALRKALEYLNGNKFIMPDLRRPNVMLTDECLPAIERLRIIDFDWHAISLSSFQQCL
jgi:hypothetical protein